MNDVRISAYLITLNEGEHLDEVLASLGGVDEIVIMDSGSTDNTLAIAHQHGARVIHQPWLGFARQKAKAMEACSHEWLINLDGDEVLPPGAIDSIRQAIHEHPNHCFAIKRDDLFMGAPMTGRRMRYFKRIYPKSQSKWRETDLVHEHIDIKLPCINLPIVFKHYGYDTIDKMLLKMNQYAKLKAEQRRQKGRPFSIARLLVIFPLAFLKVYLLNRHIACGWRGFIRAWIQASYFFLTEAHLYQQAYMRKLPSDDHPTK